MRPVQGNETISVRPRVTTLYRLRSSQAATGAVRVRVAPQPRFSRAGEDSLAGVAAPGAPVQVQRRLESGGWVTVAVALAHEDGTWRTTLRVEPGSYRAYVASGDAVGTSPELIFCHFAAEGEAVELARAVRTVWDRLTPTSPQ